MIPSPEPWLATFVTRWHAGTSAPWLAHTMDRIGGHGGRMAVLALHFWPDASRDLLAACVTHDLGEYVAGDLPWSAKAANPEFVTASDAIQGHALEAMGFDMDISRTDLRRLKFLDRLDAYLWAQHHAPQIMSREDWVMAGRWLVDEAEAMEVAL